MLNQNIVIKYNNNLQELSEEELEILNKLDTIMKLEGTHFIRVFLNKKAKKSINTSKNYEIDIKQAFKFFFNLKIIEDINILHVRSIDISDAIKYTEHLKNKYPKNNTVRRKIRAISSLYKWIIKYNSNRFNISLYDRSNPFANLEDELPKREQGKVIDLCSMEDIQRLLNSFNTDLIEAFRNKLLLKTYLNTGARKESVLKVKISDIEMHKGKMFINLTKTKNGNNQKRPINDELAEMILEYLNRSGRCLKSAGYLFVGHGNRSNNDTNPLSNSMPNKILNNALERCNMSHMRIHDLRHIYACECLKNDVDILDIQEELDHKNLRTTEIYLKQKKEYRRDIAEKVRF